MIIILTGPAGAGKTTIGKRLAARLGWAFIEGDEYHPYQNVSKMARGIPLTDDDRWPWLAAIRSVIERHLETGSSAVAACSALKERYRRALADEDEDVVFVYLKTSAERLEHRLTDRVGHFMPVDLLASQLATLETSDRMMTLDNEAPVEDVVSAIIEMLQLQEEGS